MTAFAAPTSVPALSNASRTTPALSAHRTPVMVAGKTIGETIATEPKYSTLAGLLKGAGIDIDTVAAKGGATVFAPMNSAFRNLSSSVAKLVEENGKEVLLRHVVPGKSLTIADIKKLGAGFFDNIAGGPLSYEAAGVVCVRIGDVPISPDAAVDDVCDNGVIHSMGDIIADIPISQYAPTTTYVAPAALPPVVLNSAQAMRARKAGASVSTVGGRKAMGLIKQLPFYMYGPPFNASKQEEYEPISIAEPEGAYVDYQLLPPGSVYVEPDSVSAAELIPISGMSKYIGETKRLVEGDALSDYSRLDDL